jgi:hypothetical protein
MGLWQALSHSKFHRLSIQEIELIAIVFHIPCIEEIEPIAIVSFIGRVSKK